MDSPGTRIRNAIANVLAVSGHLGVLALAGVAALTLVQAIGRTALGDFPITRGTWAFDVIYVYVRTAHHAFDSMSPTEFSALDPMLQGALIVIPNLALVGLGGWSLINLAKMALNR